MKTLRPYQSRAVDFLSARNGAGARALSVCPAGSGKTVIGAAALAKVAQPWDRIGWACNTREQVEQGQAALDRAGVKAEWVRCVAGLTREDTQGLDFLVVDECFQAGTLVDGIPIEEIKSGDFVNSINHITGNAQNKCVISSFRREYHGDFVKINTCSGKHLACTDGHPVFVFGHGYIPASGIAKLLGMRRRDSGETVQAQETSLQVLREQVRRPIQRESQENGVNTSLMLLLRKACKLRKAERAHGGDANRPTILLKDLFKGICPKNIGGNDAPNKPQPCKVNQYEDDAFQSDARSRGCEPSKGGFSWSHFSFKGRKRENDKATRGVAQIDGITNGVRRLHSDRDSNKDTVSAKMLQGGFGGAICKTINRGGRELAQIKKVEILRREENGNLVIDRVESVEVYKSGSGPRPAWLREDNFVYNLHVEGNENYFAGGVLVHNCHHLPSASWALIADACKGAIWGLTATPKSPDLERNFWFERFWGEGNKIVIPREEVMAGGHLAPGRVVILDIDREGEFDEMIKQATELEALKMHRRFPALDPVEIYRRAQWRITLDLLIENPARNALVVQTALQEIERGQSVLILVAEIEQGERLAAKIPESIVAHSKMGAKKRREAIAAFRGGELKCLIATSLADEGLDVPRASVLILATAGRSGSKIEQRTGRVMRPHEGKLVGTVYDFADRGAAMAKYQHFARLKVYQRLGYITEQKQSSVRCRKCLNPASMGAPSRWSNGKHYIMCTCCYSATGDWDSAAEAVAEWVKLNLPNDQDQPCKH